MYYALQVIASCSSCWHQVLTQETHPIQLYINFNPLILYVNVIYPYMLIVSDPRKSLNPLLLRVNVSQSFNTYIINSKCRL